MSVSLNLKYLDGSTLGGDKYFKLNFRDTEYKSTKVKGEANIYFGQRFNWPIGRKLEKSDVLILKCYSAVRIGPDRLIGILSIGLVSLLTSSTASIRENLVDDKMRITDNIVAFDLEYFSPNTGNENFSSNAFNFPVYNLTTLKRNAKRVVLPSENSDDEDEDYVDDGGEEDVIKLRDDVSDLSFLPERDSRLPKHIDPQSLKIEDFQISVTIYEAVGLVGNNLNPVFEVYCGQYKKTTEMKMQTNTPFYSEFFTFDLTCSRLDMMEQIIRIRGSSKNLKNIITQHLFASKMIGEFSIDAKTVYSNEDHAFFRKWAVLIDPKAPMSGEKGWVKVDISVLCSGDKPKRPDGEDVDESTNIEGNLLIPSCVGDSPRRLAEMSVLIFQAEDLPCMNTSIISNIKHAILGEGKALTDAYVEVSFAGYTGRTKAISHSYSPDWNQQVIFTENFPPYVTRLRLAVRDKDMIKDETISTIFIDLHKIMYAGSKEEDGYLPTYGPSWINLYGTPRTYSYAQLIKGDEGQNQNLAEGVAYRGRIMIAIKTSTQIDSSKIGVEVRPCNPVSNTVAGKRESYLLFAAIYETTLINVEIGQQGKPITFEMSIGTTGNVLDDTTKPKDNKDAAENQYIHSTTQARFAYTFDNQYFHIPYQNKKPCLFMVTNFEDHRPRMFIPNILEKLKREMCEYIRQTNYILVSATQIKARKYLKQSIKNFILSIDKVIAAVKSCRGTAKKTLLDVKYQRLIRLDLEKMKVKLDTINRGVTRINLAEKLRECNTFVKILEDKISDPQFGLPDVFLYMVQENLKVAYARIKSRDIIYSALTSEKGVMCGLVNTIYLKKLDTSLMPSATNYNIQAQLQLYLWLGLLKDMRAYKQGLPLGYSRDSFVDKMPPKFIDYLDESMFQLRVYLYMARNVIGSDDTGLSDPFARILMGEHVRKSTVFYETRSPMWDETLVIDGIIFNYTPDVVKSSPPNVVVEVFDWDSDTDEDFLGRVFCQPNVFIKGDTYVPPKLQWWSIYRGNLHAGDLLAAFDLIEIDIRSKKMLVKNIPTIKDIENLTYELNQNNFGEKDEGKLRVPNLIRPPQSLFRFEVLMWGVRQLQRIEIMHFKKNAFVSGKKMGIFPVNQPKITIELAGYRIDSDKIMDWNIQPNFEDNLISIDIRLPIENQYWPPVAISCTNSTVFGLKQSVGNHVIINLIDFFIPDERTEDRDADKTTIYEESVKGLNLFGKGSETDEILNEDSNSKDNVVDVTDGAAKNVNEKPATPGTVEKVKTPVRSEEAESADWWTRYYATIEDLGDSKLIQEEFERISISESDEEVTGFVLRNIEVNVKSDEEEEDIAEIPEDDPKKKKKRKKKKKKKKRKRTNPFGKSSKEVYLAEESDNIKQVTSLDADKSWVERIKIYPCGLENIKDFHGFNYPFKSFSLYRGKQEEEDEVEENPDRLGGVFKGSICIYKINDEDMDDTDEEIGETPKNDFDNEEEREEYQERMNELETLKEEKEIEKKKKLKLYKCLRDTTPVDFLVRIYIVRGINLHPADMTGKSDPYIYLKLGNKEVRDRENYIPKTLNPMFGKFFELEVTFPQESFLLVQIYDWDRLTKDDLIGETQIDLENRWLSPHRASCGIMPCYQNHGYLKWKDYRLPTTILKSLCEEHAIEFPEYDKLGDSVKINGRTYETDTMIEDDDGSQIRSLEPLALKILQNWTDIVPDCKLVPEHIETRPIYLPEKPGIQQGLLEMWVDMYPAGTPIPAPIDISPRTPIGYELRIIVVQTNKVLLINENFFTKEKTVDILVKSWMKSTDIDLQKTDVHYRSLSGQGLFNYRFVYQFDYLRAEDCIVYKQKSLYEIDESEYKTPCFLNMQVLDSGLIFSDTIIGRLKFRLSKFPFPAKHYRSCDPFQHEDSCRKFNLFKNKKVRGWWPLLYNERDKDPEETEDRFEIGGCVELDMELVTVEEAESNPVGLGRDEPNPLEAPQRPDGSFLNFLNPCNTIMYFIKYRLKWILIKALIITLFVLIIVLFIYTSPGNISSAIVTKIFG